jgi:hypothetical protein
MCECINVDPFYGEAYVYTYNTLGVRLEPLGPSRSLYGADPECIYLGGGSIPLFFFLPGCVVSLWRISSIIGFAMHAYTYSIGVLWL